MRIHITRELVYEIDPATLAVLLSHEPIEEQAAFAISYLDSFDEVKMQSLSEILADYNCIGSATINNLVKFANVAQSVKKHD